MGCWAIHSFGNDDAADWIAELQDCPDFALIRATLDEVLEIDGEIEAPYATRALAAIEVVAAALGKPTSTAAANEDVLNWLASVGASPDAALVSDSRRVIGLVLGANSELAELWRETDDFDEWLADVRSLESMFGV